MLVIAQLLRWQILGAVGCAFEVAIFGVAIWLLWSLRTTRGNKAMVLASFSFRLVYVEHPLPQGLANILDRSMLC